MRRSDAGRDLERALADEIGTAEAAAGATGISDVVERFGAAEAYRGDFLSIGVTGSATIAIDDGEDLTSGCAGSGAAVGLGRCSDANVTRGVPSASLLGFTDSAVVGEWAIVALNNPANLGSYEISVSGDDETDLSIVAPVAGGGVSLFRTTVDFDVAGCGSPLSFSVALPVSGALDIGCGEPVDGVPYAEVGPSVQGMLQLPEADPLQRGRVVAVLFDEAIDPATVNGADYQLRYLHGSFPSVVGPMTSNRMKITRLLPRGRVLFVSFFSSVSRLYDYTLSVGGFADLVGNPLETDNGEPTTQEVSPDFVTPPGGIVQGFVRRGDGTRPGSGDRGCCHRLACVYGPDPEHQRQSACQPRRVRRPDAATYTPARRRTDCHNPSGFGWSSGCRCSSYV